MDEDVQPQPAPPPRRRRFRRILLIVVLTLVGLVVAEVCISRGLAWKLKETVADKLDAELEIKSLWFIPPVGVYVSEAALVRDGEPLVRIGPTELRLARIPWFNRPLVIKSLDVDDPAVEISRTEQGLMGGPGLVKPGPTTRKYRQPKKLSDVLQLHELIVRKGRITYTDRRPAQPLPMTWNAIDIHTDLTQESASRYAYSLKANSGDVGDLSAAGTFDVDELMVKVQDLLLKLAAVPYAQHSPLPAPAQRFIREYEIRGQLTANATANIPLRDIDAADYGIKLVLQNGSAFIKRSGLDLDRIRTTIEIEKPPPTKMPATGPSLAETNTLAATTRDTLTEEAATQATTLPATRPEAPPLVVRVLALDATSGNVRLWMDRGKFWLDLTHGEWEIVDLSGHLTAANPSPPGEEGHVRLAIGPRDIVRRIKPAGHIDFTATGSGPLAWAGRTVKPKVADYQFIAYPRDVSFAWPKFPMRFESIGGGNVRLQHGVVTFENLSGRYGTDQIRLTSARIPLAEIRETISMREINSVIVFSLPLKEYPEPMMKLLSRFTPVGTYVIGGDLTLRRRKTEELLAPPEPTTRPALVDYNLMISTDTGGLVFSDYHIPVTDLRADFLATPAGLVTKNARGKLLGGDLTASLTYQRGERSSYDTSILIKDARLEALDKVRNAAGEKPFNMKGRVFARGILKGAFDETQSATDVMTGGGEAEIIQGEIFKLPVLYQLLSHVKGVSSVTTVGEAATSFSIQNRAVTLTNTAISSPLVGIQGSGIITFDGNINSRAIVAPLADWKDKIKETRIPVFSAVAGELVGGVQKLLNTATSNLIYQFRIEGPLTNPKITPIPAPVVTDSVAFVFGKMVQGVHDGDLMKTVKQAPPDKEK